MFLVPLMDPVADRRRVRLCFVRRGECDLTERNRPEVVEFVISSYLTTCIELNSRKTITMINCMSRDVIVVRTSCAGRDME